MTANEIQAIVQKHFKLNIKTATRKREFVEARWAFIYMCYNFSGLNKSQIAMKLGKNHATVIHALKELPYLLKYDPLYNEKFQSVLQEVKDKKETGKHQPPTLEKLLYERNLLVFENQVLKDQLQQFKRKFVNINN